MSTNLYLGIRSSDNDDARESGGAFLNALNQTLAKKGLELYTNPAGQPPTLNDNPQSRSALEHIATRTLTELATLAQTSGRFPALALIRDNPQRVTFVPRGLEKPVASRHFETIAGKRVEVWIGSLAQLAEDLVRLGRELRIPLADGVLANDTADSINMYRPFHERDSTRLLEEFRPTWLALYEGVRLAIQQGVALTIAT